MLRIENLSKTYGNGVQALKDVSLEIPRGMFGLLGPNGAGKSTLMRTIATLQQVDAGRLFFDDIDVLNQKHEVRKILGYLPQEMGIYPGMSAEAMLDHFAVLKGLVHAGERREVVEGLLRLTNLYDVRKRKLGSFSGGMRRRFGIAQALLGDPELIIVDEPTAGLDPEERLRFLNLLSEIGESAVVILSTHIVEDVRELCSRMAILSQGRVLLRGEPGTLVARLEGRVWRKVVGRNEVARYLEFTRLAAGRTVVHVLSDSSPGDGFEPAEPDLEEFGFEHHLHRFASLPPTPYSDFNGYGQFLAPFGWYSVYWGFGALVLVGLSILFWKRGTDDVWSARWASARARFRGPARAVITVGAIGFVAVGSWIFYNTNVLNEYVASTAAAERRASYERLYRQYQVLDLPRIIAVRAEVDIFPDRKSIEIRGTYRIRNRSAQPLRDIHVSIPEPVHLKRIDLPAHDVILEDEKLGYGIYRLRTPLEPGADIELGFDLAVENRGFVNHGAQIAILDNGTYFTKRDFFPVIGYDAQRQLADPDERRQRGLEPVLRLASSDDSSARRTTPRSSDADRVDFETTVSTTIDQIAVTSGELQREWIEDGRRYFHYRSETPITHYFAYASARYEVTRSEWNDVAIEVYHHPGHGDNVGRMIDAARKSLAYFTANFGPYQHRHLRIVEFPRYVRDATSFPGLIAFSEALGFNARLAGEDVIDFPFYVTAHEVAHQWWGQQMVGANVQGVGMLHETLAQYSALMVMEDEVGREKMRRVLEYELDWYLRGRAGERGVEPPLALVERQDYVYYHKGALAMYALRDAAGEVRLNQALARYLSSVAYKEPPYTTTAELLEAVRSAVPEGSEYLVSDLFENITMFDNEVAAATFTERADNTFLVRIEMETRKLRADSAGAEREIPIDDWIDIAVFGEGEDGEGGGTVLRLERRPVRASPVAFEIVVDRRPARVAIDPYYKLIDRDRGDNVRAVLAAGAQVGGKE